MDKINTIYRKLFDLRHSEVESVIIFQVIFFILLFCLLMVKPTAAALFISEFGADELPRAFIMVAIVAGGVTQLISWMNRYPITNVIKKTIILCASLFIIIGSLMSFDVFGRFTPYLLYLWVSIFALVSTSQYWLLGNMIFNADQAKRVFGLIGSGSIAGAALGGYFSSGISILGGAKEVSIFVGLLLLICLPLTNRLIALNEMRGDRKSSPEKKSGFLEPFTLIKDSKLLKSVALIVLLNVLVSKIIDYHFGVYASRTYTNEDELSAFYGFTYSTYNVIGFLIQLLVTSKVIKKIGVSNTLIILPASILISFFGLMIIPGLFFAVLLKMSDTSFKQSFQRSGVELAMIPVPHYIKAKVKPFIDIFIDSVATGIAGILLIILTISPLDKDIWTLSLGVFFAIIWLILTRRARNTYFASFAQNSNKNGDGGEFMTPKEFKENIKQLADENKFEEIQKLLGSKTKYEGLGIDEEMISLYNSGSEKMRLALMNFLYFNPDIYIPFPLKDEIDNAQSDELKQSLISYAVISDDYKDTEIYGFIENDDWRLQIITIYALINYYGKVPYIEKRLNLKNKLPILLAKAIENKNIFYIKQCLSIMAIYKVEGYEKIFINFIQGEEKTIKSLCLELAPLTGDVSFLNLLLKIKLDPRLNQIRIEALSNFGDKLIDLLELRLNDLTVNQIILSCKALGKMPNQEAANMLMGFIVHSNTRVRQVAVENLSQLLLYYPDLTFLEELINNRIITECKHIVDVYGLKRMVNQVHYFSSIEDGHTQSFWLDLRLSVMLDKGFLHIFQLLGIVLPNTDFDLIYRQLKKKDEKLRQKSLHLMKETLPPKVFIHVEKLVKLILQGEDLSIRNIIAPNKSKLTKLLLRLKDKGIKNILKSGKE